MPALAAAVPIHPPPRRRRRPVLALAAGVLALHALLIPALRPERPPRAGAAERPPRALQVRALPAPALRPLPPGRPADGAAGERIAAEPAELPRPRRPVERAAARGTVATRAAAPDPPAAPAPVPRPAPAAAAGETASPGATDALDLAEAEGAGAAPGAPPPVYATRLPAPVLLRYALRYNGRDGTATLAWRHDGRRWQLRLDGRDLATQPLVEQASEGEVDAAGLAPERLLDRRGGRRWQAAHFRRDIGSIRFSGPALAYPAWPGAQDRLSWLAQVAAILAADPAAGAPAGVPDGPPAELSLFVVDAGGHAALWRFVDQGEQWLDTPLGPLAARLWRREPPRPEGLRVEAWLDPTRGHWPLQLRFTAPRSGHVFELRLAAEPAAP